MHGLVNNDILIEGDWSLNWISIGRRSTIADNWDVNINSTLCRPLRVGGRIWAQTVKPCKTLVQNEHLRQAKSNLSLTFVSLPSKYLKRRRAAYTDFHTPPRIAWWNIAANDLTNQEGPFRNDSLSWKMIMNSLMTSVSRALCTPTGVYFVTLKPTLMKQILSILLTVASN